MADNNVQIIFGADIRPARDGIEQLRSSIDSFATPIRSAIDRFKQLEEASRSLQSTGRSTDAASSAADQASTSAKLAEINYRRTQETLSAELRLHLITYDQETAALIAALDRRHAAEAAADEARYRKSGGDQETFLQQRQVKDAKYALDREKLLDHQIEQDAKAWQSALQPIQSAWDSQLRKLLAGTETFGQAMKHVFADLVLDAIKQMEKLAVEKAATGLAGAFGGPQTLIGNLLGGGGIGTNAASMAKLSASVDTLNATLLGHGALTTANTTATAADTAATTAETTATTSEVAAQTASSAGGLFSGFSSGLKSLFGLFGLALPFAAGTDYVLNSGLAFIHQGETIVPARGTGPFTGTGLGSAFGAGDTHNWNISAVDAASFQRWLGAGGAQQIARAVSAVQARSPSMSW